MQTHKGLANRCSCISPGPRRPFPRPPPPTPPLTCQEAGDVRGAVGEEAGVIVHVVEGQQGPAVVSEAIVDIQQPQLVGQVAQFHGQGILAAVHHAGVHEGGERIDLVSDGDVASWAGRAGAEEGDAVTLVLDAGVVGRDLQHRGAGGGRGSSRAGTEVRSGSPPSPPRSSS